MYEIRLVTVNIYIYITNYYLVTLQSGPALCAENVARHTKPPVTTSRGANEDHSDGPVLVWRAAESTSGSSSLAQRVRIGTTTCFVPMSPSIHVFEDIPTGDFNARTLVCSTSQFEMCGVHMEE